MYYHYPMSAGYGFWGFLGGVVSFVFWIFVIIFVIKLIKRGKKAGWPKLWGEKDAVELLRERFAKGEIGKEEFEEKLKILEK